MRKDEIGIEVTSVAAAAILGAIFGALCFIAVIDDRHSFTLPLTDTVFMRVKNKETAKAIRSGEYYTPAYWSGSSAQNVSTNRTKTGSQEAEFNLP